MVKFQNKSNNFTILYLPNRSLRLLGKQEFELTPEEEASPEFKQRKGDFRMVQQIPVTQYERPSIEEKLDEVIEEVVTEELTTNEIVEEEQLEETNTVKSSKKSKK